MKLQIIKTEKDYQSFLGWVDEQFDDNVTPQSETREKLQIALY